MVPTLVLALLVLALTLAAQRAQAMGLAAAQAQRGAGDGASGAPTIARGTKLSLSSGLPRRLLQTSSQSL